jgi:hypothetical protein
MIDTPKATTFDAEIKDVRDYYWEGKPLADRLAWQAERLDSVKADFDAAMRDFEVWERRYDGTIDHPVSKLVRAIQASVDYLNPDPYRVFH